MSQYESLVRGVHTVPCYTIRNRTMKSTTLQRASRPLILGLGLMATAAHVAAAGHGDEDIDGSFNNGDHSHNTSGWFNNTFIGGYGELHLNLNSNSDNEIDFHRWVLFINHTFNDKISLYGEFELEHSLAGDGKPGEVELEQAYIDIALNGGTNFKAGLFLLPVGTLNESHEPNTFYGVERNPIEKNIIPTTWWEAGLALSGKLDSGLGWEVAAHSGLNVPANYKIRSGRQKVAEAVAEDAAFTARLTYSGSGFTVGGFAQYQSDITQGRDNADATLVGASLDANMGDFRLRGLVASWDIGGAAASAVDADKQWGYYIEPSYRLSDSLGVFVRYNEWEDYSGDHDAVSVGVNYWPHENVVFKADYTDSDSEESVNLGVGYQF